MSCSQYEYYVLGVSYGPGTFISKFKIRYEQYTSACCDTWIDSNGYPFFIKLHKFPPETTLISTLSSSVVCLFYLNGSCSWQTSSFSSLYSSQTRSVQSLYPISSIICGRFSFILHIFLILCFLSLFNFVSSSSFLFDFALQQPLRCHAFLSIACIQLFNDSQFLYSSISATCGPRSSWDAYLRRDVKLHWS